MTTQASLHKPPTSLTSVVYGFGASAVGLFLASIFFEEFLEMAATGLTALSLSVVVNSYLEDNRRSIWDEKSSPLRANSLLATRIASLFGGIFLGALLLQFAMPSIFFAPELASADAYQNTFLDLLQFNATVLLGGSLFAMLYRAGGLVTILAWNGIHWSNTISSYLLEISETAGGGVAALVSAALFPHLALEVIAYVLAGMGGIFISKAMFKYSLLSDEFTRVAQACIFLLVISVGILALSVFFEIYLAQTVFHSFVS